MNLHLFSLSLLFAVFILSSNNQSFSNSRKKRLISRFRNCGSRMVDAIRFSCQIELWKPSSCNRVSRLFCNSPGSNHPICNFNCSNAKSNHSVGRSQQNNSQTRRTRRDADLDDRYVQRILRFFNKKNQSNKSRLHYRRKMKRNSEMLKCCEKTCSVDILAQFCNSS